MSGFITSHSVCAVFSVISNNTSNGMSVRCDCVLSLSRFVASCGFTPDVKVWEVCFGKGGEFREVARAFELKGHSAGVHAFAFSNDSHRCDSTGQVGV